MQKPRLSFWQIWNMSFGFFGIQFGWGLQMANMSAIYQYLGAAESDIAFLWLAAPLTGLLVQPIVGYASDRTWGPLGRRRPYFLVGALLASLALIAMPNSGTVWMAAGLLWILDASINITMEPFRAFVGDLLPREQRKTGFAMQSLLIGFGAVLSSALPYLLTTSFGVSKAVSLDSPIPPSVRLAFYIGSAVFFAAVLYTILTTREYPPENLEEFRKMKSQSAGLGHAFREILGGIGSMPKAMRQLAVVQFFTWLALFCMWIYFVPAVATSVFGGRTLGVHSEAEKAQVMAPENKPFLVRAAAVTRAYDALAAELQKTARTNSPASTWYDPALLMLGLKPAAPDPGEAVTAAMIEDLIDKNAGAAQDPTKAEQESPLVQNIASVLLQQKIDAPKSANAPAAAGRINADLKAGRQYQAGASWGGVCFSAYNGTAFVFAFALLAMARKVSARSIHRVCLMCGGLGLILVVVLKQPHALVLAMMLVGVAWASILSMPYAMLSNAIPAQKMGFYMGVFNFFIVIPQILASLGLGLLMKHLLGDSPMNVVLLGGCSMVAAGLCVSLVSRDVDQILET